MEKLEKVIAALEMHEGAEGREVSCEGCPYEEYVEYCLTVLHKDVLEMLESMKAERDDLRKDIEAQGEIILELNRDLKRCRGALNGQGEYTYLGGDLISREALRERIEGIDWYHEDECGKSTVLRKGASSEEEAWFKAPDIFAAVRDALAVEAEPVVHAHWVPAPDIGDCCYRCSNCGRVIDGYYEDDSAYCARCGAHMDEEVADG